MKKFLIFLACQIAAIAAFAQQPQAVNTTPQRYVYALFSNLESFDSILLDSATGELYYIAGKANAEKTTSVKFVGGPCEDVANSYNGRFTLTHNKGRFDGSIILVDHKLGKLWQTKGQINKATLIPIFAPSE